LSVSASVVMPAYNSGRFLGPALDSVLSQSRDDYEILVVDDGSTDDTCAVARRQPRVRLFQQSHGGASAARNLAVREARAPIIAFLDSDDVWHPDHLETMLGLLERNPEAIGAASGMDILSTDGRPTGQSWIFGEREDLLTLSLKGCPMLTSAVAVRRELLLLEPFDEALSTAHDWDLWIRLLLRGRFALAGRVTAGYRRHGGALSMNADARQRNRHRIVAKHAGAPWVSMLEAYVELHDMRRSLAAGWTSEADEQLASACRHYPPITQDLQWWAFFEGFRSHNRPQGITRGRFWQAVRACVHVCTSRALAFHGVERRRALAEGLQAASYYARISGLSPEAFALLWTARLGRFGLKPRPAPPIESDRVTSAR
jgi:glycosyltransferase involved in cell wall biosynthesis